MLRRCPRGPGCSPCWCASAGAEALTPARPLLLGGNESAAYAEDARAVFFNPAGLGVRYPAELFTAWSRLGDGRQVNRWAAAWRGFAVQGERVEDESQRYGFTLAGGGEALRWGLANDWRVDPWSHHVAADHRFGLLSHPAPWLALGGVADLFQPTARPRPPVTSRGLLRRLSPGAHGGARGSRSRAGCEARRTGRDARRS